MNIGERNTLVVLMEERRRNFLGNNFAKEAVGGHGMWVIQVFLKSMVIVAFLLGFGKDGFVV